MLKIYAVKNSNEPIGEWVTLDVTSDGNLEGYAIVDQTFADEKTKYPTSFAIFLPFQVLRSRRVRE